MQLTFGSEFVISDRTFQRNNSIKSVEKTSKKYDLESYFQSNIRALQQSRGYAIIFSRKRGRNMNTYARQSKEK